MIAEYLTPTCVAALEYASQGYRVLPCVANEKRPLTAHGCKDATTDPNQIKVWWRSWPDANVAIATNGLLVVDIDAPEGQPNPWLADDPAKRAELTAAPTSVTPRGGNHHFFRQPAGQRFGNTAGRLAPHVDTRGDGGYVLVAPSEVGGASYRWENPLAVSADQLSEPPAWILATLKPAEQPDPAPVQGGAGTGAIADAVTAMLKMQMQDGNDGSKRLYACGCRAVVEHDLKDTDAIAAVRDYERERPFPRTWDDADILCRVRDAEREVVRGSAYLSIFKPEHRTDAANAKRLAVMFGESVRWVDNWRKWLTWDGRRWAVDERRAIDGFAKQVGQAMWRELFAGDRNNDAAYRFVRSSNNANALSNMISLARSEPGIAVQPNELDSDPFLLNCGNGTLDLRTGTLRAHDRADYLTKLAPVNYDPAAKCPNWLTFLDKIFAGDADLIAFMRRLTGYCLTGATREQILAIFYGEGANGKSTLLNCLLGIWGDYAKKAPPALMQEKGGDSHPTTIAALAGVRLAIASETSDGGKLPEARVKELSGGEPLTARRMHQDHVTFTPSSNT